MRLDWDFPLLPLLFQKQRMRFWVLWEQAGAGTGAQGCSPHPGVPGNLQGLGTLSRHTNTGAFGAVPSSRAPTCPKIPHFLCAGSGSDPMTAGASLQGGLSPAWGSRGARTCLGLGWALQGVCHWIPSLGQAGTLSGNKQQLCLWE